MAIGTPTSLGTNTSSSSTTVAVTTGAVAPAGKIFAVLVWGADPGTGTGAVSGGTGLSWSAADAAFPQTNGTVHYGMSVFTSETAGLASGQTITGTISGTTPFGALLSVFYVTGLATSSYLDQTPAATFRTSPTVTWTTPTLATANADDLLVAVALSDASGTGRSSTAGGGFTELHDFENASIAWVVTVTYRIVAATGSYAGSGTWSVIPEFTDLSGIVAYKADTGAAAAVAGPARTFNPIPFMR